MKGILRLLIFVLLALPARPARAQYVQITNLAGTTAYGSLTATVTSGGSITTWTNWCAISYGTSYWVGETGPGWYKYVLNHAVSAIHVYSYAINGGPTGAAEYLELYLNGTPYSLTAADMTSYTDCGSGGGACYLYSVGGVNVIMGPTPAAADYNGGDFIHTDCSGITSFELYSNGNEEGVTYYVFVDTTFSCFNATANTPCLGDSLKLTVTGGDSSLPYTWYGVGGFTSTVKDPVITPATMADTGWYYVVQTIGGVNDTAKVHVLIHYTPPITGATTLCVGGTTTLSDDTTGGTWHSGNTTVATVVATTGVVTGVSPGTSIITYTSVYGCTVTDTVTVVLLSPITGVMTMCQGSTTILYESAGTSTWTSSNTAIAIVGAGTGIVTGVSGGTANITFTTTSGCHTSATVTVNPTAPITGAISICQGFTTSLADGLPGGTWSSSAPAIAPVSNTGIVTGINAGVATISYLLPTGCLMTTVVTVHPKPAPPVVSPPTTFCQYTNAGTLTISPTTGLVWYGPGITTGSIYQPTIPTSTPGAVTLWVTDSTSFGCISDSTTVPITITAQPAPPATRDSTYCEYSTVVPLNYQVDSSSGSYLTWYNNFTGGASITTPTPPNNDATYPGGTTWYVAQTVNGCTSNRSPVKVTIVYKPSFNIIPSQTWVCDHDSLTFTYSTTGSTPLLEGSYLWQLPLGATIVGGSDTSTTIAVQFDTTFGQHFIYLTVGELNNMCSTNDTVQVSVIALPTASSYMNPNVCVGDTVSLALSAESPTASIFTWYIDGTLLANSGEVNIVAANSNSGGPFSLSWNDTGSHIITVATATEQGCKSLPVNDTVDVHALPNATFTFKAKSNSVLCLEDSVQFAANYISEACSYLWQPAHGFQNDNKPVIWGKVEETQSDITLTVTDPFGCVGVSTQQLDPSACCTVMFPNAFTPNGDGKNDVFRPLFSGEHNFHSFRIVNRWGQTIFESANSLPSWDGTFNGVAQDIGTYYYFIQYDCGGNTVEAKGDVTLIR